MPPQATSKLKKSLPLNKLTLKQARWQDFLVGFDYVIEYRLGCANLVANALNCKGELMDTSRPQSNLWDLIKDKLQHDSLAQAIIHLIKER